jgi:general stress protein 26
MSATDLTPAQLEERLWKEIGAERIVMLGLVGGEPHHMQPMAAFGDEEQGAIWFFTKKTTDLVKDTGGGHDAMVCVMAHDREFQACIHGELTVAHDQGKIDQYWSAYVAAWYPQGKDDPDLTLMRMDALDARVWVSQGGLAYPLKIAKANLTHTEPNVGTVGDVKI